MGCIAFCRLWTAEDAAADADEITSERKTPLHLSKLEAKGEDALHKSVPRDEVVIQVKEVEQQGAAGLAAEKIPHAETIPEVPPTAQEISSATDVEEVSKDWAPSSGGSGGLTMTSQQAEAMKRVDGDLMEGGLLLTQVVGGRKAIRRLEVERDSGVLKWEVDAVFGMKWDKVKLSEARIVRTGNQVKVGVEGRSEFLTFEACDEDEAAAVCNALVGHAKKHETTDL